MHDLLTSSKFRAAWARLDALEHGDRMAALEGIRRILSSAGYSLEKLLENAIEGSRETAPSARPSASPEGFSDIFEGIFGQTFSQAPKPQPRPTASKTIVQGQAVPEYIVGKVTIHEIRPIKGGRMAVVRIEDASRIYDPLVAFNSTVIEMLQTAADHGTTVRANTSISADPTHNAKIQRVSIMV